MVYTVTTTAAQEQVLSSLLALRAKAGDPVTADQLIQVWATHPLRAALEQLQQRLAAQRLAKYAIAPPAVKTQIDTAQAQIDTLLDSVQVP